MTLAVEEAAVSGVVYSAGNARSGAGEPALQRLAARLTGSAWFWSFFLVMVFGLPLVRSILRPLPAPAPVLGEMPAFELVDSRGKTFSSKDVTGRIVIAEFTTPALLAASASPLAQLQRRVRNTGDAVHLVTFLRDSGAAETAEAGRLAHPGLWRWTLAGGSTALVEEGVRRSLSTKLGGAISLDGKLLLVDARGRIRRVVGGTKEEIDLMMRDIGLLLNLEGKR